MMERITILECKLHDICELSKTMRIEHKLEVLRSSNHDPERALLNSYLASSEKYTVLDGNNPIFIFGVSKVSDTKGTIWGLGSKEVDDVSFEFAKAAKKEVIPLLLQKYEVLRNQIDAKYVKGIKFLKFLGAEVNESVPIRRNGYDFYEFKFIRGGN